MQYCFDRETEQTKNTFVAREAEACLSPEDIWGKEELLRAVARTCTRDEVEGMLASCFFPKN